MDSTHYQNVRCELHDRTHIYWIATTLKSSQDCIDELSEPVVLFGSLSEAKKLRVFNTIYSHLVLVADLLLQIN
jgi:hypothetical protein